jgi:hypothetical protein
MSRNNVTQKRKEAIEVQSESTPSYSDIENRAYAIHEERGGSAVDNWLQAEWELKKNKKYESLSGIK